MFLQQSTPVVFLIPTSTDATNLTNAELEGVVGTNLYNGTGILGYEVGGYFRNQITAAGTVTNSYGVYIDNPNKTGGAAITTNYGLYVNGQTAGTTNYAAAFAGGNVGVGTITPVASLDVRGQVATQPIASIAGATTFAAAIVDQSGTGDLFTASKSGATKFVINNAGNVGIGTNNPASLLTLQGHDTSTNTTAFSVTNSAGTPLFAVTDGAAFNTASTLNGASFDSAASYYTSSNNGLWWDNSYLGIQGNGSSTSPTANNYIEFQTDNNDQLYINGSGNVGIGTNNTSPLATLDVRGNSATTPAASVSASSTFAALDVNNSGSGDLFTASKSGATKFVINNNGDIQFGGGTSNLLTLAFAGGGNPTIMFPNATGNVCLSTNNCGFSAGTNYWQSQTTGAIEPFNTTYDLLLGGSATTSAKFAFIGNAGTANPVASISAQTGAGSNGLVLSSGSIQSLSNNTLTIGGGTTGNIAITPNNGSANGGLLTVNALTTTFNGTTTLNATALTAINGNASLTLNTTTSLTTSLTSLTTGGSLSMASTNNITLSGTNAALIGGSGNGATLTLESSSGGAPANDFISFKTGTGQTERMRIDSKGNVGIGTNFGTNGALATLDVRGNSGTTPAASVSATSSFASLVVNNAGTGDLFAASKSGATKFVITNAGNVGIGTNAPGAALDVNGNLLLGANSTIDARASGTLTIGNGANTSGLTLGKSGATTTFNSTSWTATPTISGLITAAAGITINTGQNLTLTGLNASSQNEALFATSGSGVVAAATTGSTGLCLLSGAANPSWQTCPGGSNYWQLNAGAIAPFSQTLDLLFGGTNPTATASAGFHLYGTLASGTTPVASVSAKSSYAGLVVDNSGTGDLFTASKSGATEVCDYQCRKRRHRDSITLISLRSRSNIAIKHRWLGQSHDFRYAADE